MAAVHRAHKKETGEKEADSAKGSVEPKPVVVSDTVIETTERIEVVEEVPVDGAKSEDLLSSFKEKMNEEEHLPSDKAAKKNFMWPILFIFVIAIFLLVGIFIWKKSVIIDTKVNVVTLSPTPTLAPEPTKTVNLTKYEIEIQNGSGVDGEAGRQKDNLEAEGFTVSTVGNADDSDYTKTIIKAKKEVETAFLDKLKSVLETSFVVGDTEELPEDADSSVIVILGSETN